MPERPDTYRDLMPAQQQLFEFQTIADLLTRIVELMEAQAKQLEELEEAEED